MGLFTKVTKCAFCGAPITTGMFGGSSWDVTVGLETMHLCINCYNQINPYVEEHESRLYSKIRNYVNTAKVRLSGEDLANLLKQYMQEEQYYSARYGVVTELEHHGFFRHNGYGLFSVAEAQLDNSYTMAGVAASNLRNSLFTGDIWFSREDITCLEYCYSKIPITDDDGTYYYSFDIRLNDPRYFTYRPCIINVCLQGGSGLFNNHRKAEDQLLYMLEAFKRVIGTNLPIVKHDKFRY